MPNAILVQNISFEPLFLKIRRDVCNLQTFLLHIAKVFHCILHKLQRESMDFIANWDWHERCFINLHTSDLWDQYCSDFL